MSDASKWEFVSGGTHDDTERLLVPGGWLYRNAYTASYAGAPLIWGCFVPAPHVGDLPLRQALTWCVENEGETLSDHPQVLARCRHILGMESTDE